MAPRRNTLIRTPSTPESVKCSSVLQDATSPLQSQDGLRRYSVLPDGDRTPLRATEAMSEDFFFRNSEKQEREDPTIEDPGRERLQRGTPSGSTAALRLKRSQFALIVSLSHLSDTMAGAELTTRAPAELTTGGRRWRA